MTGIVIWAAVAFVLLVVAGLGVFLSVAKATIHKQVLAISTMFPEALTTSAQSAVVTRLALRRIGDVGGYRHTRTGPIYSVVATRGHLRLVRGRQAQIVAQFSADQVGDVRVGTTSVLLADYTTLFFGIRTGGNTFELPVRVNGPRATSMLTASRGWARVRGDEIMQVLRTGSIDGGGERR